MATIEFNSSQKIEGIELVMLDKDGTIIDIHHYWCSMIRLRAEFLSKKYFGDLTESEHMNLFKSIISCMGVNTHTNKLKSDGPVGIKPRKYIVQAVTDLLNQKSNKQEFTVEMIEKDFKSVDDQSQQNLNALLELLPGVEDFLIKAKKMNIKLAIATTDITPRAIAAMKAIGLSEYFDYIVGADRVIETKPNPEMAEIIMSELGVAPENTMMVGDHLVDVRLGKNAQIKCSVGVGTGLETKDVLSPESDVYIDDFNSVRVIP